MSSAPGLQFTAMEDDQQKINLRAQRFSAGDKKFKPKLSIDQLIRSTVSHFTIVRVVNTLTSMQPDCE